jgi:polysaccharide export outer membrane protein
MVTVLGQVGRPGNYEFVPDMTLLRLIAQAGGFGPSASVSNVRIVRHEDGREKVTIVNAARIMSGQSQDYPLEKNDLVVVQESFF